MNTWGASNKAFNNSFPGSSLNRIQSQLGCRNRAATTLVLTDGFTAPCRHYKMLPPNCTGVCSSLALTFEQGEQPRLLWATGLSTISHCWVPAPAWDLPAQDLQAFAYPTHPLVSNNPSKVHPWGCCHHHGQPEGSRSMGKWKTNRFACRSHAPKAGELGHGAARWVPSTAACALGRTHRRLFHIQLARGTADPVVPGGSSLASWQGQRQ